MECVLLLIHVINNLRLDVCVSGGGGEGEKEEGVGKSKP